MVIVTAASIGISVTFKMPATSAATTPTTLVRPTTFSDVNSQVLVVKQLPKQTIKVKGQRSKVKVWILDIALLTARQQQRFTIMEVAADRLELVVPQRRCSHPLPAISNKWTHGTA